MQQNVSIINCNELLLNLTFKGGFTTMDAIGIITYSKPWNMTDDRTGQMKQGVSIEYLACDKLTPVINDDGSRGVRHCKESISTELLTKIIAVPGMYKLDWGMKPGSKGKMEVKLVDIEYVGTVDIT